MGGKLEANANNAPDGRALRTIGFFISTVGIGIAVLALASLRESWSTSNPGPIVLAALAVTALTAATWMIFEFANPLTPPPATFLTRVRRAVQGTFGAFVIAGLLAVVAGSTWAIIRSGETEPQFDQFVLHVPSLPPASSRAREAAIVAPDAEGLRIVQVEEAAAADPPATDANDPPVLVSWSARRDGWEPPKGLLPTFIGAALIIAIGVWFPHVGFTGAEHTTELVGKIVAPVLSLGLVAFGAHQNIEAAKIEADAELAERGLPAFIGLPGDLRNEARERIFVVNAGAISPAATQLLDQRITALQQQLQMLIDNPTPGPVGPAGPPGKEGPPGRDGAPTPASDLLREDVARLSDRVVQVQAALKTEASSNRKLTQEEFDRLRTSVQALKAAPPLAPVEQICGQVMVRHAMLGEPAKEPDTPLKPKRRHGLQKIGDWLVGKPPPPDLTAEVERKRQLREQWLASKRESDWCRHELAALKKPAPAATD